MSEENIDVVEPVQLTEVEREAKKFGWRPKDEFNGSPDDWKPAEEFMKRGKEINGFLRAENEKILKLVHQKDAEIAEIRQTIAEFAEHHKKTKENAYKEALSELRKEKAEAVEQSDGERVVELDEKIDALKEAQKTEDATTKPKEKKTTGPAMSEDDWNGWHKENDWYGTDEVMTALANGFGDKVKMENPDLVGVDFLNAVADKVRKAVPEAFESPSKRNAAVTGSTESRPSSSKKKTYNDLPADAKAACDKYVKQELLTREQYVAEYFSGE